ncbi:hypothetical protein LSCM1_05192 [Leishmania martiniquensis]|uniref:Uncharacterized protein n=1 Tax=Leishmania martiniquensis TaxID=1580590 RepID=A0A836KPC3_9TRYP|nr:hypothetical protein LSCM1_05192 [Leishmania martiniquensis]
MEAFSGNVGCHRVPFMTRADLARREAAEDHRALLLERWASFASRKGYLGDEERTKCTTETWEEFEERKEHQKVLLKRYESRLQEKAARADEAQKLSEKKSAACVEKLMVAEAERKRALLQARHFLFVDYYDYQQFLFCNMLTFVENEEELLRRKLVDTEDDLMCLLATQCHLSHELQTTRENERVEQEAAAERLRELQHQQRLEEERILKAQLAAQEREAAQAEKEQAEMEKRLERKRRDDERRAKARAEREQRRAQE